MIGSNFNAYDIIILVRGIFMNNNSNEQLDDEFDPSVQKTFLSSVTEEEAKMFPEYDGVNDPVSLDEAE
jgi:hypothetical protein